VYSYDSGSSTFGAKEWGFAVNYYIDGHADKVTLDASKITSATTATSTPTRSPATT